MYIHMYARMCVGVYCPKLISLDLSGVALTLKSMKALTEKCDRLKVNLCAQPDLLNLL